jgi:hypothetical protein
VKPDDARAVLVRAEQAIEILRTRHVCAGWQVDEDGADRALKYFRAMAAGAAEDDDAFRTAIDFLREHGQSVDWILAGDPGGMICQGAAKATATTDADAELLALRPIYEHLREEELCASNAMHEPEMEAFRMKEADKAGPPNYPNVDPSKWHFAPGTGQWEATSWKQRRIVNTARKAREEEINRLTGLDI